MATEVKIGEKVYQIRELLYKDLVELEGLDKKESAKKILLVSTGMTEEEYQKLPLREGVRLQKEINRINELEDFHVPQESNQN